MAVVANLDAILGANVQAFERGISGAIVSTEELQRELREAGVTQREWNRLQRTGANVTQSVVTAEERYQQEIRDLNRLLRIGAISQETFNRATRQAQQNFSAASAGAGLLGRSIRSIGITLLATAATYAGFLSLRSLASRFNEDANALDDLAKRSDALSILPERLREIQVAAALTSELAGEQLPRALQRFQTGISQAADGTGVAIRALEQLQLDPDELNLLSVDQQINQVSDAIANLPNPNDQLRITADLFGQRGAALVNTLRNGSDAIQQQTEFLRRNNLELSRSDLAGVESANDAFTRLAVTTRAFTESITADLSPAVEEIFVTLLDIVNLLASSPSTSNALVTAVEAIGSAADFALTRLEDLQLLGAQIAGDDQRIAEIAAARFNRIVRQNQAARDSASEPLQPPIQIDVLDTATSSLSRYQSAINSLRTPSEIFNGQVSDLNQLLSSGQITDDQFDGLIGRFEEQRDSAIANLNRDPEAEAIANALQSRADSLIESLQTPLEELQGRTNEIQELFSAGLIDSSQFDQLIARENASLDGLIDRQQQVSNGNNIRDAIEQGSDEAFDIIFGGRTANRQEELAERQNDLTQSQIDLMRELINSMERVAENTAEEDGENTGDRIIVNSVNI